MIAISLALTLVFWQPTQQRSLSHLDVQNKEEWWKEKYDSSGKACLPPIFEDSLSLFTVSDPGIRNLFTREQRYQGYLTVEGALALSEAEVGVVPLDAAISISKHADLSFLNRSLIIENGIKENHPLMPLIGAFTDALDKADNETRPGEWVHWGATTQNVVQTGFMLAVRRAMVIEMRLLGATLSAMSTLAGKTADVVMAGRTHGQQAVPITLGFKIAGWIDELSRHSERLLQAQPRLFVALMGGAVGSMASFVDPQGISHGPAVQSGVARRLGLGTLPVPMRTAMDHFAELVTQLAMLGATCTRVATEVFELMQTEFSEISEPIPSGTVGSSTMPQKRNPNHVEDIMLLEGQLRALLGPAIQSMTSTHEAQSSHPRLASYAVIEGLGLTGDILADLNYTMSGLLVYNDTIWYNVKELNRGLIMAEHVMLGLGETLGRQTAHTIVYKAAQDAESNHTFLNDTLWEDPRVRDALKTRDALELLMDPSTYTGYSSKFAKEQETSGGVKANELLAAATRLEQCDGLWAMERADPTRSDPGVSKLENICQQIFTKSL